MIAILVGLGSATSIIFSAAYDSMAADRLQKVSLRYKPPAIPECEEELWERIRDRCGKPSSY